MAEIFLCRTGQLDQAARRQLRRAGVVVVEVEDPRGCQFIRASELVSTDDMLWAAVDALALSGGSYNEGVKQREKFALNMLRVVNQARQKDKETEQ